MSYLRPLIVGWPFAAVNFSKVTLLVILVVYWILRSASRIRMSSPTTVEWVLLSLLLFLVCIHLAMDWPLNLAIADCMYCSCEVCGRCCCSCCTPFSAVSWAWASSKAFLGLILSQRATSVEHDHRRFRIPIGRTASHPVTNQNDNARRGIAAWQQIKPQIHLYFAFGSWTCSAGQ